MELAAHTAAAPAPAVAQPADVGPGKIVFASTRDGNPEIYAMNNDGSNEVRLTNDPAEDAQPAWSSDGKVIAFFSDRDGNREIYVMNADGSDQTRLTDSPEDEVEPAWSPDGTRIAYVSRVGEGNWEIYAMDADGANQTRLTFNLVREHSPAWSPDGTRIAYIMDRGGVADIFVMNADGSNQLSLTHGTSKDRSPAWSPDGTRIAFSSPRVEANFDIWVINADGTDPTRLTDSGGREGGPDWSPDGSKIAFLAAPTPYVEVEFGIYVMNADGSGPVRVSTDVSGMRTGSPVDWAPGSVPTGPLAAAAPTTRETIHSPPTAEQDLQLVGAALTEPIESPMAGVHVHGDYAFVGSQSIAYPPFEESKTGIRIVDISDPANPVLVGRIPLRSVEKFSTVLAGGDEPHSHGDAVATRIESGTFEGDIAIVLQGVPDSFTVDEYPMPFGIWDVTDPADPQFLGPLSLGEHFPADSLGDKPDDTKAVHGHYFYAVYNKGKMINPRDGRHNRDHHVAIVDLSDPRNPVVVGDWQDTEHVRLRGLSVNEAGTRLYVLGKFEKELLLYLLDVRDPANPVELARFVWPLPFAGSFSPGRPVANADDSLLIFADGSWERDRQSNFHILDISDLENIREIATIRSQGWAHDLVISGNLVYTTWVRGGVRAIDISDPTDPVKVGGFSSPNPEQPWLSDIALYGDLAVTTGVWAPGLYILRLSGQ